MRKIEIPNWFKELPITANLNAMDIKHMFGYSQKTEISQLIDDGSLPEPCFHTKSFNGHKRPMWRKRNLLRSIREN